MSPELIDPQRFGFEISRPTKSSDCYALGMVIYETISGKLPFHKHTDLTVFVKVLKGKRPSREVDFADDLWKMLELCWMPQHDRRPCTEDVLQCLERVSQSLGPPSEVSGEVNSPPTSVPYSGYSGFLDQTNTYALPEFITYRILSPFLALFRYTGVLNTKSWSACFRICNDSRFHGHSCNLWILRKFLTTTRSSSVPWVRVYHALA